MCVCMCVCLCVCVCEYHGNLYVKKLNESGSVMAVIVLVLYNFLRRRPLDITNLNQFQLKYQWLLGNSTCSDCRCMAKSIGDTKYDA